MQALMSVRQAAEVLGMHYKTLSRGLRENTIPLNFIRKGRNIGIRPEDVTDLMHRREVVRDGRNRPKPRRSKPRSRKSDDIRFLDSRFMTDAEVQAFFQNVEKDEEGNVVLRFGSEED